MVERPFHRVRKRRESHPVGREGLGGPLGGSGGVGRHSRRARRGREALPERWRVGEAIPECRKGLEGVGRDRDSTQEDWED